MSTTVVCQLIMDAFVRNDN